GVNEGTAVKDHRVAGDEISGGDSERNFEIFEGRNLQHLVQKALHPVGGGEAEPRQCPAGKILEAHEGGDFLQLSGRNAATVGSADDRAYAGSGNVADGDLFLFEDFKD